MNEELTKSTDSLPYLSDQKNFANDIFDYLVIPFKYIFYVFIWIIVIIPVLIILLCYGLTYPIHYAKRKRQDEFLWKSLQNENRLLHLSEFEQKASSGIGIAYLDGDNHLRWTSKIPSPILKSHQSLARSDFSYGIEDYYDDEELLTTLEKEIFPLEKNNDIYLVDHSRKRVSNRYWQTLIDTMPLFKLNLYY